MLKGEKMRIGIDIDNTITDVIKEIDKKGR